MLFDNNYLWLMHISGFQFRQCLEFLDEMTEMKIPKNVIIFGAAMSCMEKCGRADIGFQLMKRMKEEGIAPNVHIYNSAISACARSNLWEKGYELYEEMEREGVKRDVVTYNAGKQQQIVSYSVKRESLDFKFPLTVGPFNLHMKQVLDAVCSQIPLGRRLFEVGVERGIYAKVSRLGEQWFELDLHFLSLGGGEIALGWWFEKCLVPYLSDTDKLDSVKSISIVTGYGKTRTRGRRTGDDGMRKRCRAILRFMGIKEQEQPNLGRFHIDKDSLIELVKKNGGRIIFDLEGYLQWKEEETRANAPPDVEQKIRARFKPTIAGSGGPPFTRVESEFTSDEYRLENHEARLAKLRAQDLLNDGEVNDDAQFKTRDSDKFHRKIEDPIGRGAGRGDDADPSHAVLDRGRNFHNNANNMTAHRSNPQGHFNQNSGREMNRFSDQRISHQQYGDDNNVNGNRRFDQNQDYDQRLGGRSEQHSRPRDSRDHLYENPSLSEFQGVEGDFAVAQSHHIIGGHPSSQRQLIDDHYGERPPFSRDVRVVAHGTDHIQYQDEAKFLDARQQTRDQYRNNSVDHGFQGRDNWRHSEHVHDHQFSHAHIPEMDHRGLRGRDDVRVLDERNSFSYDQRMNHGRGDEPAFKDASYPNNHQNMGSTSNYEGEDSMQYYREDCLRNASQDILRKRQYMEESSQVQVSDAQADRLPISNNSRGYALEPDTQRRRLS